jgi:hypothetical protein
VRTMHRTLSAGLLAGLACVLGLSGCTSSGHAAASTSPGTDPAQSSGFTSASLTEGSSDSSVQASQSPPRTSTAAGASSTLPSSTPPPPPVSSSAARTASIVVTYAGWNASAADAEAAAYVQALEPAGGTCTLTMTRGSITRTSSKSSTSDVSTTQCGTISIPGAQLSSGQWTATVSYSSNAAVGTSTPVTIEVP